MTTVAPTTLAAIGGARVNANMASILRGLKARANGLERPERLMHYLGQLAHESGSFRFDHEIWGPTPAQTRYEGRADLGNIHPGDGFKFRGRGVAQITGRANYRDFTAWARAIDPAAPDFTEDPDAILTDPWEGLAPIWFWQTRNLNLLADQGDIEGITRRINGGQNGLQARIDLTGRAGAVLFGLKSVREFQQYHALTPDGVFGPITRRAMHGILCRLPAVTFTL